VKKAVGAGGADGKEAVARMVKTLLQVEGPIRSDATDALAIAMCHLNQCRYGGPRKAGSKAAIKALGARLRPSYEAPPRAWSAAR
jgi:crossover junction endodeoxyribonuclease RuvC